MMRRFNRERLESVALWLAVAVLVLCGTLLYLTRPPKVEPVQESKPFYIYHVVGGMEEDVGHIIERVTP